MIKVYNEFEHFVSAFIIVVVSTNLINVAYATIVYTTIKFLKYLLQ